MKQVINQSQRIFELRSQESMNVPLWKIIGFQERDRQDSQNLNNDNFCWLLGTSAQCILSTEKEPDSGVILIYDDDEYSRGFAQTKEAFRASTKENILTPY